MKAIHAYPLQTVTYYAIEWRSVSTSVIGIQEINVQSKRELLAF